MRNKQNIFYGCKSLKKINISHEQIHYLDNEIDKDYLKELKFTSEQNQEIDEFERFQQGFDEF